MQIMMKLSVSFEWTFEVYVESETKMWNENLVTTLGIRLRTYIKYKTWKDFLTSHDKLISEFSQWKNEFPHHFYEKPRN